MGPGRWRHMEDGMEERLRFHDNNRAKRAREIRKRNKRKRNLWIAVLLTLLLVAGLTYLDRRGVFEVFFSTGVTYEGPVEYAPASQGGTVSRSEVARMAQLLINHPFGPGGEPEVLGIPDTPLDAAGFVDWVYFNVTGRTLSGLSALQAPISAKLWDASTQVMEGDLQVGDLGFYHVPEGSRVNHVGIYIGDINGHRAFIHAGGVDHRAEGLPQGRIVISLNNTLRRNNQDVEGYRFSPAAEPVQFVYYRRPKLDFGD